MAKEYGYGARRTDPITSHDAFASLALPFLEEKVLQSLLAHPDGLTLDELIRDTGLDKVTVSPRLRPLCNKNLVHENGKRPGDAGRLQTVWVAFEHG